MRNFFPPETSSDYARPEYIDELIKTKVYKDTPFVIYKEIFDFFINVLK